MFTQKIVFSASGKNLQSRAKNPIFHIKAIINRLSGSSDNLLIIRFWLYIQSFNPLEVISESMPYHLTHGQKHRMLNMF